MARVWSSKTLYAGSPIGQHILRQALDTFNCDFVQFYGTTETSRPSRRDSLSPVTIRDT